MAVRRHMLRPISRRHSILHIFSRPEDLKICKCIRKVLDKKIARKSESKQILKYLFPRRRFGLK